MPDASAIAVADPSTRALRRTADAYVAAPAPRASSLSAIFTPGDSLSGFQFDSYELCERIGAGGMGVVYRARHRWLGRTVAIKFISPAALCDPSASERFANETLAIGALDHPHIVRATDAGCWEEVHFLVTDFLAGQNLDECVARHGPLRVADACEIIRQAALGLQHAYEQGLVHRDIKPANLFVVQGGTVKILDFGLARQLAGQATLTGWGQLLGTLDYLAPEQADKPREADIRADIYSLGCTLHTLLFGEPPFCGPKYETTAAKIRGHLTDVPARLAEHHSSIPAGVVTCLRRMLEKSPGERFAEPWEVARALAPYCQTASLGELVAIGSERSGASRRDELASAGERCLQVVFATGSGLMRMLKRVFVGRTNTSGQHAGSRPLVSASGLASLLVLGFVVTQFSCVPLESSDWRPSRPKPLWKIMLGQ